MELVVAAANTSANPYFVAVIAVGGTIVGAVISSVTTRVTVRRSLEGQERALRLQLEHASIEAYRVERRGAYAAFLDAMERWNILVLDMYQATQSTRRGRAARVQAVKRRKDPLWNEWRAALCRLQLVASDKVDQLAVRIFTQYQDEMDIVQAGGNPHHRHDPDVVTPVGLIVAMQQDVGIREGIQIDPRTGLRAWPDDPGDDDRDDFAEHVH